MEERVFAFVSADWRLNTCLRLNDMAFPKQVKV